MIDELLPFVVVVLMLAISNEAVKYLDESRDRRAEAYERRERMRGVWRYHRQELHRKRVELARKRRERERPK